MSQNDLSIANQGFASFRSDLNSALQALGSTNSGTSAPSTTYANQLFYDTTNNILKIRNEDNDAFISLFTLDQTNDNIESLRIDGVLSYVGDLQSLTSGTSNFRAGVNAGDSITSGGNYNVFIGDEAGQAITTGDSNVAVGFEALTTEDTHSRNTAIGHQSLKTLNAGNNSQSTAVGYNSAKAVTTGIENTFIGASSGESATTPNYTVAVGKSALGAVLTGDYNTAVGYHAGIASTSATLNTLVGAFSGDALTDGTTNCALGYLTLSAETSGQRNTAMGYSALANQNGATETQSLNTAYGFFAGLNVTTGIENVFIGANAGDSCTDDDHNTFVGYNSGSAVNGGFRNTFLGKDSGDAMTTGDKNVIIGSYGGNEGGLDIRTSSSNIVLSDGDGNPRLYIDASGYFHVATDIGDSDFFTAGFAHSISTTNTQPALFVENSGSSGNAYGLVIDFSDVAPDNNTSYFFQCQDSSTIRMKVWGDGDVQNHDNSYGALSDEKLKEQITDASSQWNDLKALKVRKFKMKEDVAKGDSDDHWRLGVVAQEVETAGMNGLVKNNPDMITNEDGDLVEGETITKSVKYSILYMKAVKALQEAMARIEILETKVKALEG